LPNEALASEAIRVALLLATVGDLSGSGGTERQFSDLFEFLRGRDGRRVDLVTAAIAVRRLREAGRLTSDDGVIALPLGSAPGQSKAAIAWLTIVLLWTTLRHQWDVVHICQPTPAYLPYAAVITRLPKPWRPRIAMTVVDCTLAHTLESARRPDDLYERQVIDAHRLYSRWARLDGIFSWYRAFVAAAGRTRLFATARMRAAKYCFTNVDRFAPGRKDDVVIFAGRFSAQKRPRLFVFSIASLAARYTHL
jgi:glycosyltransferase involved in cell wall biosynthesis